MWKMKLIDSNVAGNGDITIECQLFNNDVPLTEFSVNILYSEIDGLTLLQAKQLLRQKATAKANLIIAESIDLTVISTLRNNLEDLAGTMVTL